MLDKDCKLDFYCVPTESHCKRCKEYSEFEVDNFTAVESVYELVFKLNELEKELDAKSKYQWHDLRKNPNDLPTLYEDNISGLSWSSRVNLCGCDSNGDIAYGDGRLFKEDNEVKWFGHIDNFENFIIDGDDKGVIAWKHIEPFEVEAK